MMGVEITLVITLAGFKHGPSSDPYEIYLWIQSGLCLGLMKSLKGLSVKTNELNGMVINVFLKTEDGVYKIQNVDSTVSLKPLKQENKWIQINNTPMLVITTGQKLIELTKQFSVMSDLCVMESRAEWVHFLKKTASDCVHKCCSFFSVNFCLVSLKTMMPIPNLHAHVLSVMHWPLKSMKFVQFFRIS